MARLCFTLPLVVLPLVVLALAGCGSDASAPATVEDPRAYVRDQLTSGARGGLFSDPAYLITDEAFVDAAIDSALTERRWRAWSGTLPPSRRDLDRFVRDAASHYYRAHLATPEARAQVEALVRARFENPPTRMEGRVAIADLGLAPGTFQGYGTDWDLVADGLDREQLPAEVVGAAFARLDAAHPDAARLVLETTVRHGPGPRSFERYRYRYSKSRDRLKVGGFISAQPVGGPAVLFAGDAPVHTRDLERCPHVEEDDYYTGPCYGW